MTTDAAGPEFDGPALDQLAGMAELGPSRWRKLPVEIEAWRVQTHNLAEVAAWCSGVAYDDETPWDHSTGAVIMPDGRFAHVGYRNWGVIIPALEGDMLAKFGWWVIKGEAGEFYPCDPGVFEQTCEPADAPQTLAEASEAMLPSTGEPPGKLAHVEVKGFRDLGVVRVSESTLGGVAMLRAVDADGAVAEFPASSLHFITWLPEGVELAAEPRRALTPGSHHDVHDGYRDRGDWAGDGPW